MSKPIEVSEKNWIRLQEKFREDYPLSVSLIRSKMQKVLGFMPRDYKDYSYDAQRYMKNCMMLDFYCEKKRTFFIMKYGEYLNDQ
jgi:hypothetical protein